MKRLFFVLVLFPLSVFADRYTVALVPKGSSNFWRIYEAGAKKAADELGVDLVVRATRSERENEGQIQIVDYFREKKVNAIVLTPQNKDALVPSVEKAVAEGIPVVITDSGLNSTKIGAFISSNNVQAGQMAGDVLGKLLGPDAEGEVGVFRYVKGAEVTEKREDNAIAVLRHALPKASIVDGYYGGTSIGDIKRSYDAMLKEHPGMKGVVTLSTINTKGLLKSLERQDNPAKMFIVGSGVDEDILPALRNGTISALVVHNPYEVGYRGVKTAVAILKGEPHEKQVLIDVVVVNLQNVDRPEIQRLINP